MSRLVAIAMAAALLVVAGCERERRQFEKAAVAPNALAQADAKPGLQPGEEGRGMREVATAGGYDEGNAYEVAQGRQLFRWYNCNGCHAQGGGGMGPALMDERWIYGKQPDDIFATIMQGRPNGMPSFRGRIPEAQAWQLVAYVRSMSGLLPQNVAPNRTDGLAAAPSESRRKPDRPTEKSK
jgi:cytochrome c oxidase cbb3-type subunit 3